MTTPTTQELDDIIAANAIEQRMRTNYASDPDIIDGLDIVHMRAQNRVFAKIADKYAITQAALLALCNARASEQQIGGIEC